VIHLPDGQVIRPKEGYCVVGTTNERPDVLPEALLDRFEVILHCDVPAKGLLDSFEHAGIRKWLENKFGRDKDKSAFTLKPSPRRTLSLDRLFRTGDLELDYACFLVGYPMEAASAMVVAATGTTE
jgi:MoxR-like ATPase